MLNNVIHDNLMLMNAVQELRETVSHRGLGLTTILLVVLLLLVNPWFSPFQKHGGLL